MQAPSVRLTDRQVEHKFSERLRIFAAFCGLRLWSATDSRSSHDAPVPLDLLGTVLRMAIGHPCFWLALLPEAWHLADTHHGARELQRDLNTKLRQEKELRTAEQAQAAKE